MTQQPTDDTVHALLDDLYDAVLVGDRPRFDAYLAPSVTMWESEVESMMHGVEDLTAHRDNRTSGEPTDLRSLAAVDRVVDVFGQVAIARYTLVAVGDQGESRFRVSDVLVDEGDGWKLVHHHGESRPNDTEASI